MKRADDRLMRETEQHSLANKQAEEAAARASAQIAALEKQLQDATDACKVDCPLVRQRVHLSQEVVLLPSSAVECTLPAGDQYCCIAQIV